MYEFLWANPYQPGLSYFHIPLVFHDRLTGHVFARTSWDEDATWVGYFDGHLQMFPMAVETLRAGRGHQTRPYRRRAAVERGKPRRGRFRADAEAVFVLNLSRARFTTSKWTIRSCGSAQPMPAERWCSRFRKAPTPASEFAAETDGYALPYGRASTDGPESMDGPASTARF